MATRRSEATPLPKSELPPWQASRRQKIVAAARELLEREQYDQIQIRDVAQHADVALGTLYRYFLSKEHLYAEVLQEWTAPLGEEPRHADQSTEQRLRSKVHMVVTAFERSPQFFVLLTTLNSSAEPAVTDLMARQTELSYAWFRSELTALGPEAAEDIAAMLWSIIYTSLSSVVLHGGEPAQPRRLADKFIDLIAPTLSRPADGDPAHAV